MGLSHVLVSRVTRILVSFCVRKGGLRWLSYGWRISAESLSHPSIAAFFASS